MSDIRFVALPTAQARHYQSGGVDANGQAPENHVSDGDGIPCRHCLNEVSAGDRRLVLGHRPFPRARPCAERSARSLCMQIAARVTQTSPNPRWRYWTDHAC